MMIHRRQPLEEWYRAYGSTRFDLSSSGVAPYSVQEICELTNLDAAGILDLALADTTSLGSNSIRAAVADRFADGDIGRVMVGNGSSEILFLVLSTLLDAGDEVIVPEPSYHALTSAARDRGCLVRTWSLKSDEYFAADIDALADLVTPRTRAVIVNFPHNPTGVTLAPEQQREVIRLVEEAGAWLIWDAAFEELVYDAPALPRPTETYERSIVIGTLSKAYGLPGLRLGWCVGSADVLNATVGLRDRTTLFVSSLVELVAIHAIQHGDMLVGRRLTEARRNLEQLRQWMASRGDTVSFSAPDGGVCAFPLLRKVRDIDDFCIRLARCHEVLLIPGTAFGVATPRVRLGFGGPPAKFDEGLSRLAEAIDDEQD